MRTPNRILEIALSIAILALASLPFAAEAHSEGFTANKGQVHDQFRKPNPAVLYLLNGSGMNVQLQKGGFAYDTYVVQDGDHSEVSIDRPYDAIEPQPSVYQFHRIDISFVNGDLNAEIIAEGRSEDYTNYYTDLTGEDGATFVRSYSTVIYRDVWPHIDVRFNSDENGFKYDVIVHPGGDVRQVRFRVEGAEIREGANGRLQFAWADGTLEESIPTSWFEHGLFRRRTAVTYAIAGDGTFGFKTDEQGEGTLVIDPTPAVEWATLYGGSGTDIAIETGMDALNNIYLTGHTTSATFIATAGAYDATYSASQDAYLVKFNSAGTRQYGTFLGGASADITTSIAVGADGITYIGGYTNSTSGVSYPNYAGTHQFIQAGGHDGFIAQFNDAGQLIWCTYYGGSGDDRIMSMAIGPDNNLSFCGNTGSTNNISGAGAADGSYGGAQDGFLGRMAASGVKLWSTYLGGAGSDSVNDICYAGTNAVAVTGVTSSSSGISKSWAGVHDLTFNAGTDAFVARYEENGQKTWCSYYGGAYDDIGQSIAYVGLNQLVIAGTTWSLSGIATAGAVQTVLNEYRDGFLASLTVSNGIRTWGTYYGFGMQQESLGSIAAAGNGSFYVSGVQRPFANNALTSRKFLLSYLNTGIPDGQLDLLTTGNNDQTSLSAKGTMLLATACLTSITPSFPTPGAHQTVSVGGTDAGLIKLAWSPAAMGASPEFDQRSNLLRATLYHGHIKLFQDEDPRSLDRSGILGLHDATGREVLTTSWPARTPAMELDANLPPGTYVAVLRTNEGERTWGRFVIP